LKSYYYFYYFYYYYYYYYYYLRQGGGYAISLVCHSVAKVIQPFSPKLGFMGLAIGRTEMVVIRSRIRILDYFSTSLTIVEWDILGCLLPFLIQSPADFHDTQRND